MTALDHQDRRSTRLSLRDVRADALHRVLRARCVERVEDVPRLAELWSWPRMQIDFAVADLVADGRLSEDAHGRLVVRRKAA